MICCILLMATANQQLILTKESDNFYIFRNYQCNKKNRFYKESFLIIYQNSQNERTRGQINF